MEFRRGINSQHNFIYGRDFQKIDIYENLVRPFHNFNCEGLRGKPKIFFINACRGERSQNARIYYDGPNTTNQDRMAHDMALYIKSVRTGILVQEVGDFAVIYSTGPESRSIRHPENGSPVIGKLFTLLKELTEAGKLQSEEFTDIFKRVQGEVHSEFGTMPGIQNHLVKDVFLPVKGKHFIVETLRNTKSILNCTNLES